MLGLKEGTLFMLLSYLVPGAYAFLLHPPQHHHHQRHHHHLQPNSAIVTGLRHTQRVSSSIIIRLKAGQDAESPQEQEPSREESIALNKLCNQVVKSILNASDEGIDKAKAAVIEASSTTNASELFLSSLTCLLDHSTHPETIKLKGLEKQAYNAVLNLVEDSGWALTEPPFMVTG